MTTSSEIGDWSQAKLEIVRDYGQEYSRILSKQKNLSHAYIDAFAGAGSHILKTTRRMVPGSPRNALSISPPFADYHFIDIKNDRVDTLREAIGERCDVNYYEGDCNDILLNKVFPKMRYADYRRALCLLDPYGLQLDWNVILTAGKMETIEIFLNFPTLDINRNALVTDVSRARPEHVRRMTRFWGDDSWRRIAYRQDEFSGLEIKERAARSLLAAAFRERLKSVAGFKYVPEPVVMKTMGNRGPTLYYLFFASYNPVGNKIVTHIFDKYRAREGYTLF